MLTDKDNKELKAEMERVWQEDPIANAHRRAKWNLDSRYLPDNQGCKITIYCPDFQERTNAGY